MKEEPLLDAKCEDRFLIQSMLIPPEKAGLPFRDLVGSFLHSPDLHLNYFSYVIVDHSRG